ncbi:MAG TPA: 50S ribosomal protein L6 [Pirellulales bacterium]|jgi:large subunit ribosomal protein L6|nr:50S ribosomal protein L6 [Pirellulales bacterium]
MSRIGNKPVSIPAGAKVALSGNKLSVEGPLGKLEREFRREVSLTFDEGENLVRVARNSDSRQARALHGLTRALVQNMFHGVTQGYEKRLEIVGVGYLGAIQGDTLQLRVGFANEVHMKIPKTLQVTCPDQTHVVVKGVDKQQVGQFAAEVRGVRKPEPYKGKGIRYEGEAVRRKAGKAMTK